MVPVLVVGAGPVGLCLAIDLALRGVPATVVDRSDGSIVFPTAESINARTMEHFRRFGLAEKLRDEGFPPDYPRVVRFVTRVFGSELVSFARPSNRLQPIESESFSPEGMLWCPRFWFEPMLRDRAVELGVSIRWNTECTGFKEDNDRVVATLRSTADDTTETLEATYLVGCDGASSTIRRAIGVDYEGSFAEGANLSVLIDCPAILEDNPHGAATQIYPVCGSQRIILSAMDGVARWRVTVPLAADESPDLDAVLADNLGREVPYQILDSRSWKGHSVVAERYRRGRVFLAGDSAHLNWPQGGHGMNTGIGDAATLSWMLAAMVQGWGGPILLDAYEAERRPVAQWTVAVSQHNVGTQQRLPLPADLEDLGPRGERARAEAAEIITDQRRSEWYSLGLQLGYSYDSSPLVINDGSPQPPIDSTVYEPNARPGARAPHLWLADGRSSLDCFGVGFVLVRANATTIDTTTLAEAAASASVPLEVVDFGSREARDLYGAALTLVRPDGHVAWRGDELPDDCHSVVDTVRGA